MVLLRGNGPVPQARSVPISTPTRVDGPHFVLRVAGCGELGGARKSFRPTPAGRTSEARLSQAGLRFASRRPIRNGRWRETKFGASGIRDPKWHHSCGSLAPQSVLVAEALRNDTPQIPSPSWAEVHWFRGGRTRRQGPLSGPSPAGVDVSNRGHRIPRRRVMDADMTGDRGREIEVENDEESIRG